MVRQLALAALAVLAVVARASTCPNDYDVPSAPTGVGSEATTSPVSGILYYIDTGATNIRDNPCYATVDTNAGVRVVRRFLDIWTPSSLYVDAGNAIAANANCSAVAAATWTGIPGDSTDGTVVNSVYHKANIAYVVKKTQARTAEGEVLAFLDACRQKGYSVIDGLGPLTSVWKAGTKQTTRYTGIPSDANTTSNCSDSGNNIGVASSSNNTDLGLAVDFVVAMSTSGASTEPAKRFYKYARPYMWNSSVVVAPSLVKAKSSNPVTDGGYISGHTAEAWRDALGMAQIVPERFQELVLRAQELGDHRILSGFHSPMDVISGRVQGIAVVAYNLNKYALSLRLTARAQVLSWFKNKTGVADEAALLTLAHSANVSEDRFADYETNKALWKTYMTHSFAPLNSTTVAANVPKGAEILIELRLPYLTAAQRRMVLKSTAWSSGYPIMDDDEGWGRLDLFAAADGYRSFEGDVYVYMNASLGGFHALDKWRNNIDGSGMLVKQGTGVLHLTGVNAYTGGTILQEGTLVADHAWAFGVSDVYASGGTLHVAVPGLAIASKLTLLSASTLQLDVTAANQTPIEVASTATIDGASLSISFTGSYKPTAGKWVQVLVAKKLNGKFASITVDGFSSINAVYTSGGLLVHLLKV